MKASLLVVIVLAILAVICMLKSSGYLKEGLSGYGIMSGLAFNNNANRYCFRNIYDPPDWDGAYCSTIGKVVI